MLIEGADLQKHQILSKNLIASAVKKVPALPMFLNEPTCRSMVRLSFFVSMFEVSQESKINMQIKSKWHILPYVGI